MQGLKTATNKTAYLNTFFTEKAKSSGVSVGLSNSSASEGESAYCSELRGYMEALNDYMISYPSGADRSNMDVAWEYWQTGKEYANQAGCFLY